MHLRWRPSITFSLHPLFSPLFLPSSEFFPCFPQWSINFLWNSFRNRFCFNDCVLSNTCIILRQICQIVCIFWLLWSWPFFCFINILLWAEVYKSTQAQASQAQADQNDWLHLLQPRCLLSSRWLVLVSVSVEMDVGISVDDVAANNLVLTSANILHDGGVIVIIIMLHDSHIASVSDLL